MEHQEHVDDLQYISQLVGIRGQSSSEEESSSEEASSDDEAEAEGEEPPAVAIVVSGNDAGVVVEACLDAMIGTVAGVAGAAGAPGGAAAAAESSSMVGLSIGAADSEDSDDDSDDEPAATPTGGGKISGGSGGGGGKKAAAAMVDSDDEGGGGAARAPKTKNEVEQPSTAPVELLLQSLDDADQVEPLGQISAVVDDTVVVQADFGTVRDVHLHERSPLGCRTIPCSQPSLI